MRSVSDRARGDLTSKAVIRDEALRLFAARGPEAVSLRQVAAAAGVSPGLVMHHYHSRQGLRDAVDAHVGAVFDAMIAAVAGTNGGATTSIVEMIVAALPDDSPIPAYVRRLLTADDPAARALFARWYDVTSSVLNRLEAAGAIPPAADPEVRAAFLMVNDLAVLLLRHQLTAVLGVDPLTREGMTRWFDTAMAVYRGGLFAARQNAAPP